MCFHAGIAHERLYLFEMMTSRPVLTEDEILLKAESCARGLLAYGDEVGKWTQARIIANEIRDAAGSGPSALTSDRKVCDLALNLWSRERSIGKLYLSVNSRLRGIVAIPPW
jgi:hypothetical protein